MTSLLLALLALPAAAAETRPVITVDPRLELVSVVHALAGEGKGFAFNGTAYSDAAQAWFKPYRKHRAIAAYKAAAKEGLDFVSAVRLSVAPPETGTTDGREALRASLEDFKRDTSFDAFFAAQQPRLEAYAALVRAQALGKDYVGLLEEYAGEKVSASFIMAVCALCEEPEGANLILGKDADRRVFSTIGPVKVKKGEPVFDYAESRFSIWHELGHTLLDPVAAAHKETLKAGEPLFQSVADCCRGSWDHCAREHLAYGLSYAVWDWSRRTGKVDGPALKQNKEPAYVRQVAERFKDFEAERAKGATLTGYAPKVMDVFPRLAATEKGKKSSACRSSTRF